MEILSIKSVRKLVNLHCKTWPSEVQTLSHIYLSVVLSVCWRKSYSF